MYCCKLCQALQVQIFCFYQIPLQQHWDPLLHITLHESYHNMNIESRLMIYSSSIDLKLESVRSIYCCLHKPTNVVLYWLVVLCFLCLLFALYFLVKFIFACSYHFPFHSWIFSFTAICIVNLYSYSHILVLIWNSFYELQMDLHISKLDRLHICPDMVQCGDSIQIHHTMLSMVSSFGECSASVCCVSCCLQTCWYSFSTFTTSSCPNCMASSTGKFPHLHSNK